MSGTSRWPATLGRITASLFIGGLAYMGIQAAGAATFTASGQAENGVLGGNAQAVADTNASAAKTVRFGPGSSTDGTCQPIARQSGGNWDCTWSDEFNGSTLDRNIWSVIPYGLGDTCQSDAEKYTQVSGGSLHLLAARNAATDECKTRWGLNFTGGFIQSAGTFAQAYGRFEIRAKLPAQDGAWPAFWLLPDDGSYDGEIDILESYGGRTIQGGDTADFTLHVPAAGPGPQKTCRMYPDYSSGYHTYTFEWSPTSMRTLYDGVQCANFTGVSDSGTSPPAFPATFSKPYYILLDMAVQNWYPPTASTPLPMVMDVDYVRVWK